MNNKDLTPILKRINFVDRYQNLCKEFNDFDNRMRGSKKEIYDHALISLGYKFKYIKKEQLYRISHTEGDIEFIIQLILKDGLVESMLNICDAGQYYFPNGRFDFIPEKMNVEFDRKKYNLPKYKTESELMAILKNVFCIYEDLRKQLSEDDSIV